MIAPATTHTGTTAGPDPGGRKGVILFAWVPVVLLVAYISLRREMWLDEYHSWMVADAGWGDAWRFVLGDVHPPTYFALLKVWVAGFGDSPLALRSLSLLFHLVGSLFFAALCVKVFAERWVAAVIGAAFLLSPALVWYAGEARMYSVALAWACICLWAFFNLPETPESTSRSGRETILVGASLLLCLTHYTGLFFLAGLGAAWLGIAWSARRPVVPLVRWAILVAVGVGAWLPAIILQRGRKLAMDAARDASLGVDPAAAGGLDLMGWAVGAADNIASILGVFPASSTALLGLLALPFLILLAAAIPRLLRRDPVVLVGTAVVLGQMAGTLALGGSIQRRYYLLAAPALFLLLGKGLETLAASRRLRGVAISGAVAVLVLMAAGDIRMAARDYPAVVRPVVDELTATSNPGETVVFSSAYAQIPFEYHARRAGLDLSMTGFPMAVHAWWDEQPFKGWGTPPREGAEFARFAEDAPAGRFWLVEFEEWYQDPDGALREELSSERSLRDVTPTVSDEGGWRLYEVGPVTGSGSPMEGIR